MFLLSYSWAPDVLVTALTFRKWILAFSPSKQVPCWGTKSSHSTEPKAMRTEGRKSSNGSLGMIVTGTTPAYIFINTKGFSDLINVFCPEG